MGKCKSDVQELKGLQSFSLYSRALGTYSARRTSHYPRSLQPAPPSIQLGMAWKHYCGTTFTKHCIVSRSRIVASSIKPVDGLDIGGGRAVWVELGCEPCVYNGLGKLGANDAGTHGDDLGIVGFSGPFSRIGIMGESGAKPGTLLAEMRTPMPVPQHRIARSNLPSFTALATLAKMSA